MAGGPIYATIHLCSINHEESVHFWCTLNRQLHLNGRWMGYWMGNSEKCFPFCTPTYPSSHAVAQPFQPEMHLCTWTHALVSGWDRGPITWVINRWQKKRMGKHSSHTFQTTYITYHPNSIFRKTISDVKMPQGFSVFFCSFFHLACSIVGHLRIGLRLRHWLPFWCAITTFLVPITTQNLGVFVGENKSDWRVVLIIRFGQWNHQIILGISAKREEMQNIEDNLPLESGADVCIGNSICAMWNYPWFWENSSKLLAQLKSAACHEIQGKRSIIENPNAHSFSKSHRNAARSYDIICLAEEYSPQCQ